MNLADRQALIRYRIEQTDEEIKAIQVLITNKLYAIAVSRIYYAMFHILTALALGYEFQTSKHSQLLGWFNKTFIKTDIFEPKYSKILYSAFESRTESDYGNFVSFEEIEVLIMYEELKDFVAVISAHIQQNFLD